MIGPPPDPDSRVDPIGEDPAEGGDGESRRRPVLWLMVLIPALVVMLGVLGTRLLAAAIN